MNLKQPVHPSNITTQAPAVRAPAASPRPHTGAGLAYPFELQARLLEATTIPELFEQASTMLARVPGTIGAWVYQRDARGTLVLVRQWRASQAQVSPLSGDELGALVHQRWIAAHRLGHSAAEFARPFVPPGFSPCLVVPMLIGEELIGALAVERRDGDIFPYAPEDVVVLAAIAAITAQCMQTIVLRQRVADLDQAAETQEAVEQERRRIGRELHDGIVQDLAYLRLKLEMMARLIPQDPARAQDEALQITEQINRSIAALRETIGDLRRPRPPARGLTGQLRELASRMVATETSQPEVALALDELSGVRLAPEVERAVVGIVREALQNIRKHANAASVRVEVQRQGDDLHVLVADDGVGMEERPAPSEGHFGLEQMRELAEDMGGSLEIVSSSGRGTRVQAVIPLRQWAARQEEGLSER